MSNVIKFGYPPARFQLTLAVEDERTGKFIPHYEMQTVSRDRNQWTAVFGLIDDLRHEVAELADQDDYIEMCLGRMPWRAR